MIRDRLHVTDIYAGFEAGAHVAGVAGWNDHSAIFARLLGAEARLVVEVGSWLGASALALAEAAPNAEIVCLDTWLGAEEMWTDTADATRYGQLRLRHGYPSLYYEFLANVVRAGKERQITPLPLPSDIGLRVLAGLDARPDLVYIDGSHDPADVRRDIEGARRLRPAVICGDDWLAWPGLAEAVCGVLGYVEVEGEFWWKRCNF